jgi:hypothetical protein
MIIPSTFLRTKGSSSEKIVPLIAWFVIMLFPPLKGVFRVELGILRVDKV